MRAEYQSRRNRCSVLSVSHGAIERIPKVKATALALDLYRVHNKIYDVYIPFVIEKEFISNVFITIKSDNYSILK